MIPGGYVSRRPARKKELDLTTSLGKRVARKLIGKPFLSMNAFVWKRLPASAKATAPGHAYGTFLHSVVCRFSDRAQYHGTYFLRNRPEMDLLSSLAAEKARNGQLKIAVLGCSNGAEAYSILWTVRKANPQLEVAMYASDIAPDILAIAKRGVYSLTSNDLMDSAIFERITEQEMQEMFDRLDDDLVSVKPWIRKGIDFQLADAGDPGLAARVGTYPIVVANRFLCHMPPELAERCLRNLVSLVEPGGYLFVSGVDLAIRAKVALDLEWTPVMSAIAEVHEGDPSVRRDWPWHWWGLEPFTRTRRDWNIRYASVFKIGEAVAMSAEPVLR
jgi:chemotaxis methyl-accepting protein methylase